MEKIKNAIKLNQNEWDVIYKKHSESNTLPMLNVGASEREVSLCWHCNKQTAIAEVLVSLSSDMSEAKVFSGELTDAENDSQLVARVKVDGLDENTTYYYQWNTGDGLSEVCEFTTKAFSEQTVIVVGDIHMTVDSEEDNNAQSQKGLLWNNALAEALEKYPDTSFLLSPGDTTTTGKTIGEWQTLLMPPVLRSLPLALAIGNHDKKGKTYHYYTNMPNEYFGKNFFGLDRDFYFRYGDVLYLVYDSTSGNAPDHLRMTKEAVSKNKDAKWRIGLLHHGIYGAGDCIGDKESEILLTGIFTPIFESYDLDLVLTGHTHSQGRSHFMYKKKIVEKAPSGECFNNPKGIVYINSNCVGDGVIMDYNADYLSFSYLENEFTTYTVLSFKGDKMSVETRRADNSDLLDSFSITKSRAFNENSFQNKLRRLTYKPIEFAGFAYNKITEIVTNKK